MSDETIDVGLNELRALSITGDGNAVTRKKLHYVEDEEEAHCSKDDQYLSARDRSGQIIQNAEKSEARIFEGAGKSKQIDKSFFEAVLIDDDFMSVEN